jgi:sodium/potassium-transporting ATPase subunit alpha
MIPAKCTAIREGSMKNISATELVKGDVVFVKMGDKVPADVYLFKCTDMKVDNSSLTGESEPQDRNPINTNENPLEACNLAFNSSLVVSGEGFGIVIRTGDDTVIGQIASLTQNESKRASPLTEEIESVVKFIGALAIVTAVIFFGISYAVNKDGMGAFKFAVGILVAWVPQGLPATVTMLLTIAAKRMAGQNVLVKDLKGVETLGAITLLATDKTGTLTRNQMTVANVWTQFKMFALLGEARLTQDGEVPFDSSPKGVQDILHISAMCSRARFDKSEGPMEQREIFGDATETGLFRLATQKLKDFDALTQRYPKVFEVPFNSDTKWHMSIHKMDHPNGKLTLYIKGAPERVLRVCSTIMGENGELKSLEAEDKAKFSESYEFMASKGHRVLAFAKLELPAKDFPAEFEFSKEKKNYPMEKLTFVGLASLEDPPKHGVREAVGNSRRAGIKVVMVTGDHPLTAEAIGRKINLMLSDTREKAAKKAGIAPSEIHEEDVKAIVIHGEKIDSLTEEDWDNIFSKEEIIFARTSPKHKLQIVKRAQALGHIVGVTGDGVNDSPALKKADLGIAMNMSGSDVSKEAAAMILLDDNFASIINGIKEGRLIFLNLKKSIQYVLTHSIPEVIPQILYVVIPYPLAINSLQILVIDLGFELFAALSFAFEPPESDGLMKLQPRKPVDGESVEQLRTQRAFDAQFMLGEKEEVTAEDIPRDLTFREKITRMGSSEYWSRMFRHQEYGEVLVDRSLILWSYIEGGVLEFIGAQITFDMVLYVSKYKLTRAGAIQCMAQTNSSFGTVANTVSCNPTDGPSIGARDQEELLKQAQSAFYLAIMVMQMFNIFACKCRLINPLSSYIFRNKYTWYSVLGGVGFSFFIVYVPGVSAVFGCSANVNLFPLLIAVGFGFLIYLYSALRFWLLQRFRPIAFTPEPLGLSMHPTRYSRRSR